MLKKSITISPVTSILFFMFLLCLLIKPVYATNEDIPSISISKNNTTINDILKVTVKIDNPRSDAWIGLYEEYETPDGNPTAIWWKYVNDLGVVNGNGEFTLDLSTIDSNRFKSPNTYKIVLFRDDLGDYPIEASCNFNLLDEIVNGDGNLSFLAMSDVHVADELAKNKLKTALTKTNEMRPNLDAILIAGDFTDAGKSAEYDNFTSVYNQYANPNSAKLWAMGNHDYWGRLLPSTSQNDFINKTGEKIHSHKMVKGYHFIQVSTEARHVGGYYSDSIKSWLTYQLEMAKNDDPEKPIFVTVHHPVKNTVYGSDDWGNPSLSGLFADYPQVIIFAGHSHYALNDERSIYQSDCTYIGTASISYMELEDDKIQGSKPKEAYEFSQGLIFDVNKETNKVVMKRMDFYNNSVIKEDWEIECPGDKSKFKYTDARINDNESPYFEDNAEIEVTNISSNSVNVTFDQGKDDDMVHSYKIKSINKSTGQVENEFLAFSEFYLYPMPDKLSFDISGLSKNTDYNIEVIAIDSFGKESVNSLIASVQNPSITLSKNIININEPIDITFSNIRKPIGNEDWVGLYEENETPDGHPAAIWWEPLPKLNITTNATFTFDPSMISSGEKNRYKPGKKYKFIYAYDDNYNIKASTSFDVSPPVITLSNTTVSLDETIDIRICNARNPVGSYDWIGLYEENETPDGKPAAIWWEKLSNLGITNGEGLFTFDPKNIDIDNKHRYKVNNSYKFILAYDDTYTIEASTTLNIVDPIHTN